MKRMFVGTAMLIATITGTSLLSASTALALDLPDCNTEYENPFESLPPEPGIGLPVSGVDITNGDPLPPEVPIRIAGPGFDSGFCPHVICFNGDCDTPPLELTPEESAIVDAIAGLDNPVASILSSNNNIALNLRSLWELPADGSVFYFDAEVNKLANTTIFPDDLGYSDEIPGLEGFQLQVSTDTSFGSDSLVIDRVFASTGTESIVYLPDNLLAAGVPYSVRVRALLSGGDAQAWVRTYTLYIVGSFYLDPDEDQDGIFDEHAVGDLGLVGGKRLLNPVSGTDNELTTDLGTLKGITVISPSGLPEGIDFDQELPYGLFQFRVEDLPSSLLTPATVNITIYFDTPLPENTRWLKYDSAARDLFDFTSNVQFYPDRVIITLTDGGRGDADGVVNGVIVDPGGPAVSAQNAATVASAGGGGGGGCSLNTRVAAFDPTLLLILAGFSLVRGRRSSRIIKTGIRKNTNELPE